MHGEAWVNHAIQEADLLIAAGMRFDDRVTGNLKTYAPNAQEDPHRDRPVGDQQERAGRRRAHRRPARRARAPDPVGRAGQSPALAAAHRRASRATPPSATSRRCPTTGICMRRTSSTTSGARRAAATRSSSPTSASTRCGKRSTTTTKQPRSLITSGGLGTMGFARAGGDRRQARAARRRGLGDRRRRRLPDDDVRARDRRAGRHRGQGRDHQQRLSRHGPAVAGVLLRAALRGDAALRARLRQAGRSVRRQGHRRHASAARCCRRSTTRALTPGRWWSISGSSRRTRSTRWCPPAPTCTR